MKALKQMMRQPMAVLAGILLIAMAVAILATCVGQYVAAALTRRDMDHQYITIALNTDASLSLEWPESGEYHKWYQNLVENYMVGDRADIVKMISDTGLLSAYIPALTPDNYTQHYDTSGNAAVAERGAPYNCAVFVITLDEIAQEITVETISGIDSDGVYYEMDKYACVTCKGTVEQVIALQDGFQSPVGFSIELTVKASDEAALEAMQLTVGQQYLVFGMDYYDNDWNFKRAIAKNEFTFGEPFDESRLHDRHPLGEDYEVFDILGSKYYYYEHIIGGETVYEAVSEYELSMRNTCRMTVCDYASLPHIVFNMVDNNIVGFTGLADQRVLLEDEHSDMMLQRGSTLISKEEFMHLYSIPTMLKLETSIEEILNSATWRAVLESMEVNNHAFPVLAVDKLGYQAEFAREQARIVEGRDFTQAELENGERVCIISQTLAVANGLTVGDTITMQTYHHDPNITEPILLFDYPAPRSAYPHATYFSQARGFSNEPETYTIVGLYRQNNENSGFSSYGFLTDTIFIPKSSTSAKMVTCDEGLFRTIVLQNGKLDDFNEALKEAGYEEMFVVYDRGYSEIATGLNAYQKVVGKAIYVGIGAYAIILLLYLILFPGRQKRILATMGSLGVPKGRKFVFILSSSLVIMVPGTILGAAVSVILRDFVTAELMKSVGVSIPLIFGSGVTTFIAAAVQLAVALVAVSIFCLMLVKDDGIVRKGR